MNVFLKLIVVSVSVFIATNLDDIIILIFFYSQVNLSFRIKHIIIGQYLGFSVLLLLSLPGFFGAAVISEQWLGLLGLIPICLGIKELFNSNNDDEDDIQGVSALPKEGIFSFINPYVLKVMAVCIANGGDNISIYLSFFASLKMQQLLLVISIFYLLLGVLCVIAYSLTRRPQVAHLINRYGKRFIPYLYIALGVYILLENYFFR